MRIRILDGLKRDRFVRMLDQRGAHDPANVEAAVRRIVNDVRRNGDLALRRYATRWDGLPKGEALRVPEADLDEAWKRTPPELRDAIIQADLEGFTNEEGYHILWQFSDSVSGPWNMGVLQDDTWYHFRMDLGDPAHRAAFLDGEMPADLSVIRGSGPRD